MASQKKPKGSSVGYLDSSTEIEFAIWNDNGAVTMGPNFESIEQVGVARCWLKDEKDYVNLPRPALITSYNKYMGGTVQMDQVFLTYRPTIVGLYGSFERKKGSQDANF